MPKVVNKDEFTSFKKEVLEAMALGKTFIYPTDTIYGMGCDATNSASVRKIRDLKGRPDEKPLIVIAPSKDWILENCEVRDDMILEKLPGPFTLIFKLKNKEAVASEVNLADDTIGVRIPENWFTQIIQETGIPFITTSVNLAGGKYMRRYKDIPESILEGVDYVIYDGEIKGVPSKKINLSE